MKRARLFLALGALAAALAIWAFVSTRPTAEERAEQLLDEQVAALVDPDARAAVIAELRSYNPEWDFMHRTFLALSLVDRALARPEEADRLLPLIDQLVWSQIEDQRAHGDAYFLLPYVHAAPFRDPSGRSVFVDGEIALVLGARRFVRDDPVVAAEHRARVEALAAQFARSPALLPESYPDEAWLFCNTNALVAIRMADQLDGTDHQELIDGWLANARTRLVEDRTGLLGSEFSWSGEPFDGPEGSSVWLVAANLRLLDPDLAQQQYERARASLVRELLGFGYAREWGPGWQGPVDVDSGPIVPILQASPSSSGFALLAARAFGDRATFGALARSLGAADLVTRLDPRLAALADNPMGDVIVLHALTFGPLWERVGAGRPVWVAPEVGVGGDGIEVERLRRWADPARGLTAEGHEVMVWSCAERVAYGEALDVWDEYRTWGGGNRFQRCFALDLLSRAAPARVSHLGQVQLEPALIDQLPPSIGWLVNPDLEAEARRAEAEGRPWSAADASLVATMQDDVTLQVRGDGFWQLLQVWGRGDLDGDGAEDLLLASRQGADGGSLAVVGLVVVSRPTADGPLRVVQTVSTGG